MKSFAIMGYSDDVVCLEVDGALVDEKSQPCSISFVAGGKALHAKISFSGKNGTGWKISVELQDDSEEGSLPFTTRIVQENYSPKLIVEFATEPVSVMCRNKLIGTIEPSAPAAAMKEIVGKAAPLSNWDGDCG